MAEYIRQDHHLPHGSLEPHITNGDRIRMMTDEELAKAWWEYMDCGECPVGLGCNMTERDCKHWVLDWLKKDADLD